MSASTIKFMAVGSARAGYLSVTKSVKAGSVWEMIEMVETDEHEDSPFILRCKDCHTSCQLGNPSKWKAQHKCKRKRAREEGETEGENPSREACSGGLSKLIVHNRRSNGGQIQTGQLNCIPSGSHQDRKRPSRRNFSRQW
jgi:hypothetical protein